MKFILIALFLFVEIVFCQSPTTFVLKSTDCITVGPSGNKVVSSQGSPWKARCIVNGNTVIIESIDLETGKVISKSDYEYFEIEKVGVANSAFGNVKYLFDFSEMKFYQGQLNIIIEEGMILTKTCVGQISIQY